MSTKIKFTGKSYRLILSHFQTVYNSVFSKRPKKVLFEDVSSLCILDECINHNTSKKNLEDLRCSCKEAVFLVTQSFCGEV